jgi:hypothetical protein
MNIRATQMRVNMQSLGPMRPRALPIVAGRLFHGSIVYRRNNASLSSLDKAQTLTEKIVQRYSLGLPKDKVVKSGGMNWPFYFADLGVGAHADFYG